MLDKRLGKVGGRRCFCTQCTHYFSSPDVFDAHQSDSDPVICYNPVDRGLIETNGIWHRKDTLAPGQRAQPLPRPVQPASGPLSPIPDPSPGMRADLPDLPQALSG